MAQPANRHDFDVEARKPSIPAIIGLSLVAIALALAGVMMLGAALFGAGTP